MNNISITEKLIFYFVSLGVVVILIVGSLSYYFAKKALLNRTFDQLISLRLEKKDRIEQFFLDRERNINMVSQSEEIYNIIKTPFLRTGFSNQFQLQRNSSYLSNYISSYYQRLFILNHDSIIFCLNAYPSDLTSNHQNDLSSVLHLLLRASPSQWFSLLQLNA